MMDYNFHMQPTFHCEFVTHGNLSNTEIENLYLFQTVVTSFFTFLKTRESKLLAVFYNITYTWIKDYAENIFMQTFKLFLRD